MVETVVSPLPMVVLSFVFTTFIACASMETAGVRSTLWKTMPVPGSAGRSVMVIVLPVCRPMPLKVTLFPKVCWNIICLLLIVSMLTIKQVVRQIGRRASHWKKARCYALVDGIVSRRGRENWCGKNAPVVSAQRAVLHFCYSLPERRMAIIHQMPTRPAQV